MFRLGIEVSTVEFLGRESDLTRSCVGVLISSTYLGTLKTPDIGKISAVLCHGLDRKARNYTCMVRTNLRPNKGSNGKDEGRDGDVGVYFNRNSFISG